MKTNTQINKSNTRRFVSSLTKTFNPSRSQVNIRDHLTPRHVKDKGTSNVYCVFRDNLQGPKLFMSWIILFLLLTLSHIRAYVFGFAFGSFLSEVNIFFMFLLYIFYVANIRIKVFIFMSLHQYIKLYS